MAYGYYEDGTAWTNWSSCTDSGTASSSVWSTWTTTYRTTTSASTSDTVVWGTWTSGTVPASDFTYTTYTTKYMWAEWADQAKQQRETREQIRARQAQAEINRIESERKAKEFEEAKKQAELTAQKLLEDLITDEEMETYLKTGKVLVKGKKHDYILVKGSQADVIKIDKGKVVDLKSYKGKVKGKSYCVHPVNQYSLPDTDKIVAMKIALETEEDRIMKMANARGDRELDLAVGM